MDTLLEGVALVRSETHNVLVYVTDSNVAAKFKPEVFIALLQPPRLSERFNKGGRKIRP